MSDVHDKPLAPTDSSIETGDRLANIDRVTPATFDPYLNQVFRVRQLTRQTLQTHAHPWPSAEQEHVEPKLVELTLVEVSRPARLKELEGGFEHRPREPFSLLFSGPQEPVLMSAVHEIEHDQLGCGSLFLSPIAVAMKNPQDCQYYESSFC